MHESDGSTFTDIIHAVRKERTAVEAGHPSSMRRARHRPTHQLFEITGPDSFQVKTSLSRWSCPAPKVLQMGTLVRSST